MSSDGFWTCEITDGKDGRALYVFPPCETYADALACIDTYGHDNGCWNPDLKVVDSRTEMGNQVEILFFHSYSRYARLTHFADGIPSFSVTADEILTRKGRPTKDDIRRLVRIYEQCLVRYRSMAEDADRRAKNEAQDAYNTRMKLYKYTGMH